MTTREIAYQIVDAFTERPFTGNPAGVVLDGDGLTPEEMQDIARELHAPATAFASTLREGGCAVRFFTPAQEIGCCAHAALALAVAWALGRGHGAAELALETSEGTLPVRLRPHPTCQVEGCLILPRPRFADFGYRVELLAGALGLEAFQIPSGWPLALVHTGGWSLQVPVLSPDALAHARPDFFALADLDRKLGCTSTHLYTFAGEHVLHCRNFAPALGVPEDPVTGTALAATVALLLKEGSLQRTPPLTRVSATQGEAMGRPGKVVVEFEEGTPSPRLFGTALPVGEGRLRLA